MSEQTSRSNDAVTAQYDAYLTPIWKNLNVPIKRASGETLEDFDGNEYLDAFSGISVTNVGHNNEAVVEAAKDQLDEFVHGCSYVHPNAPVGELAERLASETPGDLTKSFFCNSGTEAVEGAIKLARKYTGSTEVLALEMGFHGRTLGSLALTGNKAYKNGMAPTINDVSHVEPPYGYRCPSCEGETCTAACAENVERVIGTHTADDLAAIVVEPVMGEGGIIVPPEGWLERVQEIAHEHDALLIADEVQTGYGRTGELWAVDHFDVVPDIITQAKGIANGLPLGAFTAREEIADAFESGDHLSTFGGNPVACAAALATLEELQDGIIDNAREQGAWLEDELAALESEFDVVGDTRGLGLMYGLEIVDPSTDGPRGVAPAPDAKLAKSVAADLREEGIVIGVGGYYSNVIRLQPPLTIDRSQLERIVAALRSALEAEEER
ncbi:aspartate aminotransferase family protein [Natronorubrum daqingense]|uniref:4-aminobutyrate aminotransferase / (S)-3-amino-2-methylpropionate transaminase n=1 Tax=Natronorubrum daqingense TaxID=588898 RepID=A0A1N7EA79_9EURY|nr:aspartate aminotransferase family protein [Natronorubrum daqingense]APX96449.1 aspartate aminotransferase family protein [Natronorubrum daqingense]SIR84960.1 4-aminobutyrate aminotransferase / (S)-3-amino-2-methylpropionate transaminase [Natronorubrum daqingense]